jgi:cell division protein FtsB
MTAELHSRIAYLEKQVSDLRAENARLRDNQRPPPPAMRARRSW